jgi:hypothetical protein
MTSQVSTTDARTAKALELLSGADRWLKITSKLDGRRYYAIPSSDGKHVYWARPDACSCPDAAHRGVTCKHQIAAVLWVAKRNAERKGRASKPAAIPAASIPNTFTTAPAFDGHLADLARRERLVSIVDSVWGVDGE